MSDVLDRFTTNEYRTLKQMYESTATLPDGERYVPLSQAELSRIIGVSKVTMNRYFKYFKGNGLVIDFRETKYQLTDKAIKIVENIENAEGEI